MNRRYVLRSAVVILIAALLDACGGRSPSGQPPLEVLTAGNLSDIKSEFNAAKSDVRVVLLLSPT